jgi:hypothetical protein
MNSGDFNREKLFEIFYRAAQLGARPRFRRLVLEQAKLGFATHALQLPAAQPPQSGAL